MKVHARQVRGQARRDPARPPAAGRRDVAHARSVGIVADRRESLWRRRQSPRPIRDGSSRQSRSPARSSPCLRNGRLAEPPQHAIEPDVVRQVRDDSRPAQSHLKCAYSSSQVGSSWTSVIVSSGGRPLGSTRRRSVNDEGPHLHSERMCTEPFSANRSQVKWLRQLSSVISSSSCGLALRTGEHDMVGRAILEAAAGDDPEILADFAEPELRGVEEMRAEVRQNASALVAPFRFPHEPRRAVAVEHPAMIERAQLSRKRSHRACARNAARSDDCRRRSRRRRCFWRWLRAVRSSPRRRPERLLHQDMLAVAQQVVEELQSSARRECRQAPRHSSRAAHLRSRRTRLCG